MRRLVGLSGKSSKAIMALAAVAITLSSIHLAAAVRTATFQRKQEDPVFRGRQLTLAQPPVPQTSAGRWPLEKAIQTSPISNDIPSAQESAAAPSLRTRAVVISIADRKLAVFEGGHLLKVYPIAVGTGQTPSPDGDFVIINRAKDPTYRHGDKEIPPGKDNPLGTRWMGLSLKGYGIHGTNVQSSVGKPTSHGCFRMRKQDVEELYTLVQVGDPVLVRRERDAMIARVFSAPAAPVPATTGDNVQVASATISTVETTEQ